MKLTHRLLDWERQAILDALAAGEKVVSIASEFQISESYPALLAKRYGYPARRRGRPRTKTKNAQLTEAVLPA